MSDFLKSDNNANGNENGEEPSSIQSIPLVLHLGSDQIRIGFATDPIPSCISTAIAYKLKTPLNPQNVIFFILSMKKKSYLSCLIPFHISFHFDKRLQVVLEKYL
jgi:actin-related protein